MLRCAVSIFMALNARRGISWMTSCRGWRIGVYSLWGERRLLFPQPIGTLQYPSTYHVPILPFCSLRGPVLITCL
ncbi:hypothetical protein FPV67DRAFT_1514140 [Lyophyllum atratum]|nr:hypothetical protein FPV67DRAFT_1527198 [Lyophyllum atratum]KAF8059808.1 hypothetical protein FPV67DRAFT_1514140 [Lyophyllum atratum]